MREVLTGWKSMRGCGPDCPVGTPMPGGSTLYIAWWWDGIPGTGGAGNLCMHAFIQSLSIKIRFAKASFKPHNK